MIANIGKEGLGLAHKNHSKTMRIDLGANIGHAELQAGSLRPAAVSAPPLTRDGDARNRSPVEPGSFNDLFHSVYDGAFIVSSDGMIVEANYRASDFFGYEADAFLYYNILQVIVGADDSLLATLRLNLEENRFSLINAYCVRNDGSTFPAEIAVSSLGGASGGLLCWSVRDITVRRQAEQMLFTEHKAIQNAADGIAVVDSSGVIEFANPAMLSLWGFVSLDAVIGVRICELFSDVEEMERAFESVIVGQGKWNGRAGAKTLNGKYFPVRCSLVCNLTSEGDVAGVVVALSNLTDQIRAERAQREMHSQRVMLETLGAVCHHLGQPATVLMANIGLLARLRDDLSGEAEALLDACVESGDEMIEVIHRLTEFNEYKTKSYLDDEDGGKGAKILDLE